MIDRTRLTEDLQALVKRLEGDLRERVAEAPDLRAHLEAEWRKGKEARRTSESFEEWAESTYTQSAVAWVLACVFVRYLEDNGYLERPYLSGPGPRAEVARDHRMEAIRRNPRSNERDYLLAVFEDVGRLPAMGGLLSDRRIPLWSLPLSADGAKTLYEFWQERDGSSAIVHDFTDSGGDTRFLGDLYQDLSEAARKRFALLQTPVFVEEFLLDRTLDPAIEEFGLAQVSLIDPTCGSGHFLLGAFARLFDRRASAEPARSRTDLVQAVLRQVAGVDLNPYAVGITRFRLLLAALRAAGVQRLAGAPAFEMDVGAGDSLLHGVRTGTGAGRQYGFEGIDRCEHHYETEDAVTVDRILSRTYAVVVGNPPYITVGDAALNEAYRERYGSCYRQYSLAVPFTERFFDLALAPPKPADAVPAGFVGMITADSFMKREFGKRLIEEFIPRWDLTQIIHTSGAYIPGHGTPTVILIGRHRRPQSETIRAVMGIRGEPATPEDPARGLVWCAIRAQVDLPGSQGQFVSVADVPRGRFATHPWAMGGGGAAELKLRLDAERFSTLASRTDEIGFVAITRADEVYLGEADVFRRVRVPDDQVRMMVEGDKIRDWSLSGAECALFPYASDLEPVREDATAPLIRYLWPHRTALWLRNELGGNHRELGMTWYEWSRFLRGRFRTPLSIAFAFIATHNHFVLDRGGKVFNRSAPVIKLKSGATEDDHYALLGLLNSSVACFWMKQVFYPKATTTGDISTEKGKPESNRYEFAGTQLQEFPVPQVRTGIVAQIARQIDAMASARLRASPASIVAEATTASGVTDLGAALEAGEVECARLRRRMIALQEELDWACYEAYGLGGGGSSSGVLTDETCGAEPEDRPFRWSGETPPGGGLDAGLRGVYTARRRLTDGSPEIRAIETAVFKRPWLGQQGVFGHATRTYRGEARDALRSWLLDRLETPASWPDVRLCSTARLADRARHDADFLRVAALYREGEAAVDVEALVEGLVLAEGVPFLAALRYTASGLVKRRVWERTWDLQRAEDAIDARTRLPVGDRHRLTEDDARTLKAREIGEIPVPPRYDTKDFRGAVTWRLRGKLDVPKERFILYPGAERDADPTPVVGWAGWDHLQQAQALASYVVERVERDGWGADRLTPLLAGIEELLPWLKQWHNERQSEYGMGMGDYFERFLDEQVRSLGIARDHLRTWVPASGGSRKRRGPRKGSQGA